VSSHPTDDQIDEAIHKVLLRLGPDGCTDCLAQAYGDHPVEAATRMAWAVAQAQRHPITITITPEPQKPPVQNERTTSSR
jgi:hypothetical protein